MPREIKYGKECEEVAVDVSGKDQMAHRLKGKNTRNALTRWSMSEILRDFWDRGRVRGDRSVFVTSHRPVHSSRAHLFSLDRILHFAI